MTWQRILIEGRLQRAYVPPAPQLPAFVFAEQRKTCERCAWFRSASASPTGPEVRCTVGGRTRTPASVARLAGGICGPEASAFRAKESV